MGELTQIHDIELEAAILGRIITIKDEILLVADKLKPLHFSSNLNAHVYKACVDCVTEGGIIDINGIQNRLKKNGIRDPVALMGMIDLADNIRSIDDPVNRIIRMWKQRELESLAKSILSRKLQNAPGFAQDKLYEIMSEGESSSESINTSAAKALEETELKVAAFRNNERLPNVIYSGLSDLDSRTAGFKSGELYILAGRPGMGKSSLKRTMAINIAEDFPVKIFSKEMVPSEISNLMACSISEVNSMNVRRGSLSDGELNAYTDGIVKVSSLNIEFDIITDIINLSVSVKKWRMRTDTAKPAVVFVDYLQQISAQGKGSKHLEIAAITDTLKQIAISMNICVIALAQLSRAVESRGGDKRPILSDLRESGNIEQDADGVIFIYRPEYYGFETDEDGCSTEGMAELDIAKFRGGQIGVVRAGFVGKYGKFVNWQNNENVF